MYAPIYNSQINPPAKLYKRFTHDEKLIAPCSAAVNNDISIEKVIEMNAYKNFWTFRWVEMSSKNEGSHQPLNGLLTPRGDWSIKLNSSYFKNKKAIPCDVKYPEEGDLVVVFDELWIITDGITRARYKSMRDLAVITLPLMKIL